MLRLAFIYWVLCRQRLDRIAFVPARLRLFLCLAKLVPCPADAAPVRLRRAFERLGPIFIKFGQLLSTRPDLIGKEYAGELSALQDRVAPFAAERFKELVEQGLGAPVAELFADYEEQPLASASLAQVHGARLADGTAVVIKVIRPGIERAIRRDLRLMRRLARLAHALGGSGVRRLRLPEVVADYQDTITRECNLQREAANAQMLRDNFRGDPTNDTPRVHWRYVRRNILVMDRIDAIAVTDIKQLRAHNICLRTLAENGTRIFFRQVFEHNFFHADMHPGNIFVARDAAAGQYISVDCAIVGSLSPREQYQIASLWLAACRRDYGRAAEVMVGSGWVDDDTPQHLLADLVRVLFEPIHNRPLRDISFGGMMAELFAQARPFGLRVQPSQVLLQKTLINIEGLGKQLYADLDIFALARPYLESWVRARYHPRELWRQYGSRVPELLRRLDERTKPVPAAPPPRPVLAPLLCALGAGLVASMALPPLAAAGFGALVMGLALLR